MTNKRICGDTACPSCRARGRDTSGNHLVLFENDEGEQWGKCGRCGHYEKFKAGEMPEANPERPELSPEELAELIAEISEFPILEMTERKIVKATAERFGVRTSLSAVDGETREAYWYPRSRDGVITGYEVKGIEKKWFYNVGSVREAEFFGQTQAKLGDVYSKKLFIFEDANSCMSAYQVFLQNSKREGLKVACVALPTGAASIASVMSRNMKFVESFEEVIVCMDNDEAGEDALKRARALRPDVKFCRIPKGEFTREDGSTKSVKDANDMLMAGRGFELFNKLAYSSKSESPATSATVFDCLAEALKKPEWGIPYPWESLNKMTFGIRYGEMISIGGGVGSGKSLIGHELVSHLCLKHNERVGVFFLEETNGNTLKNIAGKSAHIPFHRPDIEYEESQLVDEVYKYADRLFLYNNFGTSEWDDIKVVIRHWVVANGCKFIILDNMTAMVGHLSSSEQNSEIGRIAAELAGMCQELNFTAFVFSHLNEPKGGKSHEEGGEVLESQFTGSRALMRWSQAMLGFERNKQEDGDGKHNSVIRLLKERNFGQTGVVYSKYNPNTGNLTERPPEEVDKTAHFRDVTAVQEDAFSRDNDSPF